MSVCSNNCEAVYNKITQVTFNFYSGQICFVWQKCHTPQHIKCNIEVHIQNIHYNLNYFLNHKENLSTKINHSFEGVSESCDDM